MQTNFLIIGSGISGLNFALHAAQKGEVIIITKKKIIDSNTNFAQGGIAAVLDKADDFQKHVKDTLEAGDHHNNKKAVEFMVKNAPSAIHRLIELGVKFEKEKGTLKLTCEGGHNQKRIAYVGDYTGKEIERILIKRVKEHPNITILENTFALDFIINRKTCYGAHVIRKNRIEQILADQTILATGGIGQLFEHTTNPPIATGDGIAMAHRAGCKLKDLEFIQFHPSALDKKVSPRFLISETVRGEGAKLINSKGKRFMKGRHPLKDLAPRSIVAKEICKELFDGPVYLDITHKPEKFLKKRFPQIFKKLKEYGINMAKDLIPITPAAHYLCGGIVTDLHGRTKISRLFAFGEVTCTGVHGANRLASNSLLEALVFSNQVEKQLKMISFKKLPEKNLSEKIATLPHFLSEKSPETRQARKIKTQIKQIMWQHAGILRNRKNIKKTAIPQVKKLITELDKITAIGTNQCVAETQNMTQAALLILKAAKKRKRSLGCHYVA